MAENIADYLLRKAQEGRNNSVGAAQVVLGSVEDNPDELAGDLNLAKDFAKTTGNPTPPAPLVKEYRNIFQQKVEEARNKTILSSSPKLAQWLIDPENAALSKDDLPGLSYWEGLGNALGRGVQRVPQAFNQWMASGAAERAQDQARGFGEILRQEQGSKPIVGAEDLFMAGSRWLTSRLADAFSGDQKAAAAFYQQQAGEFAKRIAATPMDETGERYKQAYAALKPTGNVVEDFKNFMGTVAADPAGFTSFLSQVAAESVPLMAVATAATAATRNPTIGATVMGAGSFAQEAGTSPVDFFQEKGIDVSTPEGAMKVVSDPDLMREAAKRGLTRGIIIGALDAISGGVAGKELAKNPIADMVLQSITQAAFGAGGEAGAQIAAGQQFNLSEVLMEGLAEFITAPVEAAGVGGRSFLDSRRKARDAEARQALFQELSGQAVNSRLRARMPDKFRQFVEAATANGPVENVYVPAEQFAQYFQNIGLDPHAVIDELEGVTRDDLDAALAGGGDLQIPTATYAAKIAGSEHDAFLMENMRFDPNEMTAAEAREANEKAQDALQEAWELAEQIRQQEEELRSFEQEIYDTMVSRLRVAGRSTDVATTEALLYPAFYRVMAERSGLTVEEMMQRYPLPDVRGDLPQGLQFRDVDALTRTLAEARTRKTAGLTKRGPSLLEWISDYGGINDPGGELRARDASVIRRGKGKKTLKLERSGMASRIGDMFGGGSGKKHSVDEVARAAVEAGYLANDPDVAAWRYAMESGQEAPDLTRALWSAIDRELAGEVQYAGEEDPEAEARERELDEIEGYLASLGVSLDDDDATIRQAIEGVRSYAQDERGGRVAAIEIDPNTPVPTLELSGLPARSAREAMEALKQAAGTYRTASGEEVRITASASRKALSRNANALKRSLVGEFPAILEKTVIYGGSGEFRYGVAHLRIDGTEYAARVVLRNVEDGAARFYQIEGFEVPPIAADQAEAGANPGVRGAAHSLNVAQLVSAFNDLPAGTFPLFQDVSGPRGLIQFPSGGVGNGETVIRLFQTADLSTMLHESGHYFLTVMRDMAAGGGDIAQDFEAVKGWWRSNANAVAKDAMRAMPDVTVTADDVMAVLDNGTTGDVMKDAAVDVGMQEQWARAFEAYLMEGRAPSVELRSAFEKFRAWLISVYRNLTGLNVTVSDDIRRVFDRMLATDQEIDKARQTVGGDAPLFASAEDMGLTPEEYANFLKLRSQAEDEAKARLLRETMEPIKREREKWFKEERAKVREEVERTVNAYRQYRALEWMGNRRWLGEGQPESLPDMRLSKDILVERYGEGVLKTLPRGKQTIYTVDGGIDPDDAAGWFGFDSGDEMIRALEQAPKRAEAIEAETDRIMFEHHGDPLKDGSVEEEAMAAVHTDKRGQWIAAELKAVIEVAGTGTGMTAKEARATARETLSRMRVRDAMNANRFLAAERKAAEEAARLGAMLAREGVWMNNARRRIATKARAAMRGEGSVDGAAAQIEQANRSTGNYNETVERLIEAKRRQLLNHALYMESRKVAEEVEAAERFVARLGKKSTRERIAGAGRRDNAQVDYLGAIDELLERYDFRRMSGAAEARRGKLNAFIAAMKAAGRENELAIPDAVLADAARRPYKTLPVEELRGVIDSLKNLEHIATRWDKLIDAQRQKALDEAVEEIVGAFDANVKKRPPGRVNTTREALRNAGRQFLDLVLNATTILREIDGFADMGAAYRNIKAPIDEAMTRLIQRKEKAASDLEELYSVYTKEERRRMAVREYMPALGFSLSKWERIAVALNTGNAGNYQRLTDTRVRGSLTDAQVQAVLATLDERDADFVQSVWDYVGSFRDDIAAREKRVTGVEPAWVEPQPVTIAGKTLKGGYYPLKYDPRLSSLSRDDETADLAATLQAGRFGKAQTRNGHLQARAQSSGRAVELDMSVLHRHVNQVIYDLELSEPVSNAWHILQNGRIRSAFIEAGKQADFDALEIWLQDVGTGELKSADLVGRGARTLKSNFTAAKLAFNLGTVLTQISGLSQSMVVVGKRDMAVGIAKMAANPMQAANDIAAKSPFMASRQTTFNKDIYDMFNDPKTGPIASRWIETRNVLAGRLGFWLMTKVQWYLADVPTWLAGYHQGLRKFGGDEAKAIAHADDIVKRSQASGLFSDRAAIERGSVTRTARQNDVVRLFTALGSYMFAKFNVAYERTARASRTIQNEGMSLRSVREALSWTLDMTFLFTLEAVITAAIKGRLPDDDDEDEDGWLAFLAKETAFSVMGTIPFVRDVAGPVQGFGGGGAYGAITEELGRPLVQIGQGEIDRALVKSIISTTGLASGMPVAQINRAVDAAWRQAEGEDVSPAEYIMGRSGK